ncbi:MAG: amidase [Solirubrobacteraceae bacterium]
MDEGFVQRTPERARAELADAGRRARGGRPARPLEGVRIAWKDTFDLAGYPTRAGTRFLGESPAARDHPLVAGLAAAGAICVGKTALTELACSVLGENDAVAAPRNPHSRTPRVCGGSSSGSAVAVARGVVDAALGTDCGGSVRLPATWCGVVGFKPTTVPIDPSGYMAFSPTLDTLGPLAPTVAGAIAIHEAARDATLAASPPGRLRLAALPVPAPLRPDPATAAVLDRALHTLARRLPFEDPPRCDPLGCAHDARRRTGSLAALEGAALWRDRVRAAGDRVSARLSRWFDAVESPAGGAHVAALHAERRAAIAAFDRAVPAGTVLALPASPIEPPTFAALEQPGAYDALYARSHSLLWPFNHLDAAAITIPCGHTARGLPVGLQLVAPRGRDGDVLRAAQAAESVLAP